MSLINRYRIPIRYHRSDSLAKNIENNLFSHLNNKLLCKEEIQTNEIAEIANTIKDDTYKEILNEAFSYYESKKNIPR